MYLIKFKPTSTASNQLMPINTLSKQEAVDLARLRYGKAVHSVISRNEVYETYHAIPWGSLVHYVELDEKQQPIHTYVYPKHSTSLDPTKSILDWFKTADTEPSNKNIAVQIGVHIEEFREMLFALKTVLPEVTLAAATLQPIEEYFKDMGKSDTSFDFLGMNQKQKEELLDSLADQVVTATGIASRMQFNFYGALQEVSSSNWSKFENGKPIRDDNGKIIKGRNYFKPDLTKFV